MASVKGAGKPSEDFNQAAVQIIEGEAKKH